MGKKIERFISIEQGAKAESNAVFPENDGPEALGNYFINNLEYGESVVVKCIKGYRKNDEHGESEYLVEEVK